MLIAIIIWPLSGAVGSGLAGLVMKGVGFGLVGNIIVGIVGAALAGGCLPRLGLSIRGGLTGEMINAAIGACTRLLLIGLVKRA
jgi:hypothetical protein